MILPSIRSSIGRQDALHLLDLLVGSDPAMREAGLVRLEEQGADVLLDDPRVRNALLTHPRVNARPAVVIYVLVRQALLEAGIRETGTADYVATLVLAFGSGDRAYRVTSDATERFGYLVDLVGRLRDADQREAFLLRSHLGNYALWLAGLFPDYLEARVRRRGAPSIRYYEAMGAAGYRMAADTTQARNLGVDGVLLGVAGTFQGVRESLNLLSDRYFWSSGGNPIQRLLREVAFRARPPS